LEVGRRWEEGGKEGNEKREPRGRKRFELCRGLSETTTTTKKKMRHIERASLKIESVVTVL